METSLGQRLDVVVSEKKQLPVTPAYTKLAPGRGIHARSGTVRVYGGGGGGFGGPSGELAPGPGGRVGSLVSMCV